MDEPVDEMYPPDTDKIAYIRHEKLWQAVHINGPMIFLEALSPEMAHLNAITLFKALGHTVSEGQIQIRRLPVCKLKIL